MVADLAELHEVAVVADRVGAELVLVADRGGGGGDLAELHEVARQAGSRWSPRTPSCWTSAASSRRSPVRQARGSMGERLVVEVVAGSWSPIAAVAAVT